MGPLMKVLGILWRTIMILLTLLFLAFASGCTTTHYAGDSDAKIFWCDTNRPIRATINSLETLSDDDLRELVSHNRFGQQNCGWRP